MFGTFSNCRRSKSKWNLPNLPGYVYDELPPDPLELGVMEEPIFVAFENIEVGAAYTPHTIPLRK